MFRVTTLGDDGQRVHLKVEGRILGDWASEITDICDSCLVKKKMVFLDFSEVSFIDRRAIDILNRALSEKVQIVKAGMLIQALLGS